MGIVSTFIFIGLFLCVSLGAIYLRVWFGRKQRIAYLYFSLSAIAAAVYAASELRMMHAPTPDAYLFALNWGHIAAWGSYISFMLFLWHYLNASRSWIFWTGASIRTVYLLINFLSPVNANFSEIPVLKQVVFLGETFSVAVGARNPLMLLGHIGTVWILVYCIDTAITVWRRGDERMAQWVGICSVVFIGGRLLDTVLVLWGIVEKPLTVTPFFMGLLISMGYRLTLDVVELSEISERLEREKGQTKDALSELEVAKEAGNLGVWVREFGEDEFWASREWRKIFGFGENEKITFSNLLTRIHPDDRSMIENKIERLAEGTGNYTAEYRIILPSGEMRWIYSRGRLERKDGIPVKIFGASADITDRKSAEFTIHSLGSKLIDAQEAERARLGRELHDDLSQRLAILSIELEKLHDKSAADLDERINQLSESVQIISSDVRRISHELHPAKLDQLGLAVAIRGFCREISEAHGFDVEFRCGELPRTIPPEISLCAYRIVQEALQNVAKHSQAEKAITKADLVAGILEIQVVDDGKGFDAGNDHTKATLGLISMRQRLAAVSGNLVIESQAGTGTTVTATIPISQTTE